MPHCRKIEVCHSWEIITNVILEKLQCFSFERLKFAVFCRLKSFIFGGLKHGDIFGKVKRAIFGRLKCAIFEYFDFSKICLQLFIVYITAKISSKMMNDK